MRNANFFVKCVEEAAKNKPELLNEIGQFQFILQREFDRIDSKYYRCLYPSRVPKVEGQGRPNYTAEEIARRDLLKEIQLKTHGLVNKVSGMIPPVARVKPVISDEDARAELDRLAEELISISPHLVEHEHASSLRH